MTIASWLIWKNWLLSSLVDQCPRLLCVRGLDAHLQTQFSVSPFPSIVRDWNSVALRPASFAEGNTLHTTPGLISRAISGGASGKKRAVTRGTCANFQIFKFPLKFEIARSLKFEIREYRSSSAARRAPAQFTRDLLIWYHFSTFISQLSIVSVRSPISCHYLLCAFLLYQLCSVRRTYLCSTSEICSVISKQTYRLFIYSGIAVIHRCDGVHCDQTLDSPKRLASFFFVVMMGGSQQYLLVKP